MNGSPYPPRAPHAPIEGGRDWDASQARATRRLEARVAAEQRQTREVPVQGIPSMTTLEAADVSPVVGQVRSSGTWVRATLDTIRRRSSRTPRA